MIFEGLDLLIAVCQLLFKRVCECVPPSESQLGSLREIERARFGLEIGVTKSVSCYSLCRYFDSCYFASSQSLVMSAETRKEITRNLNCTQKKERPEWNNLCYTWSLCERRCSAFCVLGCFFVTVELEFFYLVS